MEDYIDHEFIDALYFKDRQAKDNYISSVIKVLETINETGEISRMTVSDYMINKENAIPFLMDAIKADAYNGQHKIKQYYTALGICRHNIIQKIENDVFDFDSEESLAATAFTSEHRNYARLETLFLLGEAYFKKKDYSKMHVYFAIIYTDKYELAEATISNFYRAIADIYIECQDTTEALKWYRSGLALNPKLGVKKLILKLEKVSGTN